MTKTKCRVPWGQFFPKSKPDSAPWQAVAWPELHPQLERWDHNLAAVSVLIGLFPKIGGPV